MHYWNVLIIPSFISTLCYRQLVEFGELESHESAMSTLLTIAAIFTITNCGRIYINPTFSNIEYGANGGGYIEGFVSHGVNNFNGLPILNLSSSGFGLFFSTPLYSTYVLN